MAARRTKVGQFFWVFCNNAQLIYDGQALFQLVQAVVQQQAQHALFETLPAFVIQPKDNDAGVRARRVAANVGKIEIKGHQGSAFCCRGLEHRRILFSGQSFLLDIANVVACAAQHSYEITRHILVELEFYTVTSVSNGWASSS